MKGFGLRTRDPERWRIAPVLLAAILVIVLQCHLPAVVLAGEDEAGLPGSPDVEASLLPPKLVELPPPGAGREPLAPLLPDRLAQLLLSRGPVRPRPPPLG